MPRSLSLVHLCLVSACLLHLAVVDARSTEPPPSFKVSEISISVDHSFANNPVGFERVSLLAGDGTASTRWTELTYGRREPDSAEASHEVSPEEVLKLLEELWNTGFFGLVGPYDGDKVLWVNDGGGVEVMEFVSSHVHQATITVQIGEYRHAVRFIPNVCALWDFVNLVEKRLPLPQLSD